MRIHLRASDPEQEKSRHSWHKGLAVLAAAALFGTVLAVNTATAPAARAASNLGNGALLPTTQVTPSTYTNFTNLPTSADLRQWAAPVGDQGSLVGSCVAWTIAYGMMGWFANKYNLNARAFAPMYAYSEATRGQNKGTYGAEIMGYATVEGIDTQSDYTQGNYNYWDLPTTAEKTNAAKTKLTGSATLFANVNGGGDGNLGMNLIKRALANGQPVAIGLTDRPGLDNMSSNLNVADNDTSGASRGYHEVLALAYNPSGLIVENSWGTGWGASGYGLLSWDVVRYDVWEATTASGITQTGLSPDMKVSQSTWATAASFGTTTINVASNTSWKVSSTLPSWLTVSASSGFGRVVPGTSTDGPVTLTVQPNTSSATRTAAVTFTTTAGSPTTSTTVTVTQAGAPFAPNLPIVHQSSGSSTVFAYVGAGNGLYVQTGYSATKVPNQPVAVMSGTSPSITTLNNGTRMIAYQGTNGLLYTTTSTGTVTGGVYGMKAGTSPSITPYNGGYVVAFQANTGHLLTATSSNYSDSGTGTKDWGYVMAAGTSPSITAYNGGYEVAFQANNSYLYLIGVAANGTTSAQNLGYAMAASTSPSIAWLASGGYEIAFQASNGVLNTIGSGAGSDNHGAWYYGGTPAVAMRPGTSPSIVAGSPSSGSGYKVAYVANTGVLWVIGEGPYPSEANYSNGIYLSNMYNTVIQSGSPAIAELSTGGFEVIGLSTSGLWVAGWGTNSTNYGVVATGVSGSPSIS